MAKIDLTPAKLAEWKKELHRSIDEQVPLPRCLSTKNMLAMVEEIEQHAKDMHLVKMTFLGFLRHQVDRSISTDDLLKISSNMLEKTSEILKQESEAGHGK